LKHFKITECLFIHSFTHSFISIQLYRPGWQEPEPSHVTGMALAHFILDKFLGVVYIEYLYLPANCQQSTYSFEEYKAHMYLKIKQM